MKKAMLIKSIKMHPINKVQWLIDCCYRSEVAEEIMIKKICDSIDAVDTENVILTGDFNFRITVLFVILQKFR